MSFIRDFHTLLQHQRRRNGGSLAAMLRESKAAAKSYAIAPLRHLFLPWGCDSGPAPGQSPLGFEQSLILFSDRLFVLRAAYGGRGSVGSSCARCKPRMRVGPRFAKVAL